MKLRVALAQINPVVGDVAGNTEKIIRQIQEAKSQAADVIAFPECATCGYPAEDLLFKPHFLRANQEAVESIARECNNICAIVGFPESRGRVYNAAAVCAEGKILGIYRKIHLPNYEVFDEMRYFTPGDEPMVVDISGRKIGLSICEDIWVAGTPELEEVMQGGAQVIINISASPYHTGKADSRRWILTNRAKELMAYVCYVNQVGGQDELVFDGNSVIVDLDGKVEAHAKAFEEDLLVCDIDLDWVHWNRKEDQRFPMEVPLTDSTPIGYKRTVVLSGALDYRKRGIEPVVIPVRHRPAIGAAVSQDIKIPGRMEPTLTGAEEVYRALTLGCRDYIRKNGFEKVILGLSGGVDSAISATIAADALGAENVVGLFMPSKFTSNESRIDALALADNLGINCFTVPIEEVLAAYKEVLAPHFAGRAEDVTEENLQARIRGNYLMAFSNKFGYLVLSTGNKSENSVGYATLYGDMAGGFNIIKDVPKVVIYELCEYRNHLGHKPVIPENILTKAPTAELRAGQKDTDSLPPYPELDPILHYYIEQDWSFEKIVEKGFDRETVARVIRMVDRNEYKRRQACPGIKISHRAFGKDRRMPITNGYQEGNGKGSNGKK